MSGTPLRVVKVGGSLLRYGLLPQRLRRWLARQPRATNVLLAGGGPLADEVRDADVRWQLGETTAHWLCVSLLGVTARLLAALLPEAEYHERWPQLVKACRSRDARVVVFNVEPFLRDEELALPPAPLPHDWGVTSDSIAARLAEVLGAEELVLLKSACPAAGDSLDAAAASGYVDDCFPQLAARLARVRCVNLRDEGWPERIFTAEQGLGG